jgi:hypothetical protein
MSVHKQGSTYRHYFLSSAQHRGLCNVTRSSLHTGNAKMFIILCENKGTSTNHVSPSVQSDAVPLTIHAFLPALYEEELLRHTFTFIVCRHAMSRHTLSCSTMTCVFNKHLLQSAHFFKLLNVASGTNGFYPGQKMNYYTSLGI